MTPDLSTTVVLWHGQYSNDGRERLDSLGGLQRSLFGLRNARLVGRAGDWYLIADADRHIPLAAHVSGGGVSEAIRHGH